MGGGGGGFSRQCVEPLSLLLTSSSEVSRVATSGSGGGRLCSENKEN